MEDPEQVEKYHSIYAPATPEAARWQGWGTALKPAHEPIIVARKPLSEGTVAANVLTWGTGGLNIDGCRVETDESTQRTCGPDSSHAQQFAGHQGSLRGQPAGTGRFPANLLHDGSDEVVACFPETKSGSLNPDMNIKASTGWSGGSQANRVKSAFEANEGSAARFFYCAKASKSDRGEGNNHPTVKPQALMRYLCRLVTPPGGTVLDQYGGSGSTGLAAMAEGFNCILVDDNTEGGYDIACNRVGLALIYGK